MLPLAHKNYFTICPMCLGKGYCDEDKSRISHTPAQPKRSLRLPAIDSANTNPKRYSSNHESEFSHSKGVGDVTLPTTVLHSKSSFDTLTNTVHPGGDNGKLQEKSLLEAPAKFEKPQDALKLALLSLKQNQWDTTMQALVDVVQISRFQPELIDSSIPIVYRGICSLLRNIRTNVAKTACQMAGELFRTMQSTQRPEFDELVGAILQKAADVNKFIRQDANQALDAMADYISPFHCVRVMATSWGAGHKNPLVRATVSRLLNYIVNAIGVETLLSTTTTKNTRSSVFAMCAKFLVDGDSETRFNARSLMKLMMTHSDFEYRFNHEVDRKLTEKTKKILISLKYDTPSGSQICK